MKVKTDFAEEQRIQIIQNNRNTAKPAFNPANLRSAGGFIKWFNEFGAFTLF